MCDKGNHAVETKTPQGVIIAGPNGSGKSTCATLLLPDHFTFVNADMIAQEISGIASTTADLRAGRILLQKLKELESQSADFALETTLANSALGKHIQRLRTNGYETHLIFLWLPNDELAWQRVMSRVKAGGHLVPEETVRRRYTRGIRNFFRPYRDLFDSWRIYDNSRVNEPELIASGKINGPIEVKMKDHWDKIMEEYNS